MRSFRITEKIEIVCTSERTKYGFRHLAILLINGREEEKAKCCYYNRTWERFEFQSVAERLVEKSKILTEEEKKICKEYLEGDRTDWSDFKAINMVAKMGEIFCDNQKDKNDWKKRMLVAGLENKGLEIPEDWETLDEDTKQARLDAVIGVLGEKQ